MTLENVIDMYGSSIGKHLVSRRVEIQESSTFKGIKTYRIEIWEVNPKKAVVESEITQQITANNKEWVLEALEKTALSKLFEYYGTKFNTK